MTTDEGIVWDTPDEEIVWDTPAPKVLKKATVAAPQPNQTFMQRAEEGMSENFNKPLCDT